MDLKSKTNILSWNIQSSNCATSGSKFDDPDFCKNFCDSQFICLQETRQPITYPGYRVHNNTRKCNKYGGVCTMVENSISRGVKVIPVKFEDAVACKLDKNFFGLEEDLYLVNSYIKPAQTSTKTSEKTGLDILADLDQFLNELHTKGDIIMCGDFNARIGKNIDYIRNELSGAESFVPLPDDYIPQDLRDRNNKDRKTNSYKKPFLDLLINNKLHILNGRTLGDSLGELTCIKHNGASVVDYFAVSYNSSKYIGHMTVLPFTPYSDHKPLALKLTIAMKSEKTYKPLHEVYKPTPCRYKIDTTSKSGLQEAMDRPDIKLKTEQLLNSEYNQTTDNTYELNRLVTEHIQMIADLTLSKTKVPKHKTATFLNKKPWFTSVTRSAKRELSRATNIVSGLPDSDYLRKNFYRVKNTYKKLVTKSKDNFFDKLNTDIESGKVLNWNQFKKLKTHKANKIKFDSLDMENFEKFFKALYSNVHETISDEKKTEIFNEASRIKNFDLTESAEAILNQPIKAEEILESLSTLKNGKSSSDDMINNEILKSLFEKNASLLVKLFNQCLNSGVYPWNNSLITPLHKKGCKSNPDNYRAVAVSSNVGKLFSTILLNRLLKFKGAHSPDPVNQLGFSKGAQTYDHILTLQTIVNKYRKQKTPVYAVFVDFRKAFDSVCREALFLKLAKLGIRGKIFETLNHMYSNSTAQIKLSGHLSNKFPISKGTEQGHPLSPDLFKIYIKDLSPRLDFDNCPKLLNTLVSHLLWADDLIILALDPATLQKQLNELNEFCKEWGIEINADKTKLIRFNSKYENACDNKFKIGNYTLKEVDSYCYLGMDIHKSGSFAPARTSLKNKAMRALYSLKGTVNKSKLSFRSLTTLFDSLIKPIVLYGAPIYTPDMHIIKHIAKLSRDSAHLSHTKFLRKLSQLDCEKTHLHFLKWALGVNRKASNIGAWGESGRYPLIYECLNLTIKYLRRIKNLKNDSLVSLAFSEQAKMNLDWYSGIEPLLSLDPTFEMDHVTAHQFMKSKGTNNDHQPPTQYNFLFHKGIKQSIPQQSVINPNQCKQFSPFIIMKKLKQNFKKSWQSGLNSSTKLEAYCTSKSEFAKEPYLDTIKTYTDRVSLTRLRISAHNLEIEMGRRTSTPRIARICKWCNLSLGAKTIENEFHFINDCDLYAQLRRNLLLKLNHLHSEFSSQTATTTSINDILSRTTSKPELISSPKYDNQCHQLRLIARFVNRCFSVRANFLTSCTLSKPFTTTI